MSSFPDVLNLTDANIVNIWNNLTSDQKTLYTNTLKGQIYNTVKQQHSDSFQKVYLDVKDSSSALKDALYYSVRNKDLESTHESVYNSAKGNADAATYDSQIAKRQFEINEWTVGNKRDTLFFMQIMFIALTIYIPLLYLNRIGIIPSTVLYGVGLLLLLAVIFTFVVRYQYSDKKRDNKYWNRRRFAQMGGPPVTPTCDALKSLAEQSSESISSGISGITSNVSSGLNNLGSTLSSAGASLST
jgi:hypothetical protein